MYQDDTHDHYYAGDKPSVSRIGTIGISGNGSGTPIRTDGVSENMAVTESETQSVTIALADVGCDVPETVTCELEIVTTGPASMVVELARKDLTYIVESSSSSAELTGVYGDDDDVGRPVTVPTWIEAMCELVGIDEVTL